MVDPCAYCGASVEEGAKVCGSCGQPLTTPEEKGAPKDAPAAPAPAPVRIPRPPGVRRAASPGARPAAAPGARPPGTAVKPHFNPIHRRVQDQLRDDTRKGSATLLVIAGINGLYGIFAVFILKFGPQQNLPDEAYSTVALIFAYALVFAGLNIWSRKKALPALLTGLVLFEGPLLAVMIHDPRSLLRSFFGMAFNVVVILILLKAISSALLQKKLAGARPPAPPEDPPT